jgi:hypothetical protein
MWSAKAWAALRGVIAVLPDTKQPDEIAHGRIGVVELACLVGVHELRDAQASAAPHLAFEVGVVLLLGEVDHEGAGGCLVNSHDANDGIGAGRI